MSIFVSVAAYRDTDLIPTLLDCVRRARYPADLHFGIVWQHEDGEPAPPDLSPARMRVVDIPWQESKGACWARGEAMKLWDGEEFFFQMDSHHRFVQDWDALLLDQAERSGAAMPLLTTSPAGFDPLDTLPETALPTCMSFQYFRAEGTPMSRLVPRPDWAGRSGPVRARFLSANLLFTLGRFVEDVPYDPELYFWGEEITLAIRAFTRGYTLLHPSVHVMWHDYSRRYRVMHWDDHQTKRGVTVTGQQRDAVSLAKVQRFLTDPQIGLFGCGEARTFAEYETYSGINFRRRSASGAARRGYEPPPPPPAGVGVTLPRAWQVRIDLERSALPPAALNRPAFWYIGFHDAAGIEIARADASREELHRALARDDRVILERNFRSARPPVSWSVQPTDRNRMWLNRLTGPIDPAQAVFDRAQ